MNNPQAFYKINKQLRYQATRAIDDIHRTEFTNMSKKFFYLDHTAEVLENYRRI